MDLLQRVKDILFKPQETWLKIAQETEDIGSIYSGYLIFIAAVPALAGFIGFSLIGVGGFGMTFRTPIVTGLVNMVVSYGLSLAIVFVLALITDALAPTFGGSKNRINALKLAAYGSTAGFAGGIFSLLPALSMLVLLAALYSIYLIYVGLPILMKCPPEKAPAYTAAVVVCGIIAMVILGQASTLFVSSPGMPGMNFSGSGINHTMKMHEAARSISNPTPNK